MRVETLIVLAVSSRTMNIDLGNNLLLTGGSCEQVYTFHVRSSQRLFPKIGLYCALFLSLYMYQKHVLGMSSFYCGVW